MSNPFDIFPADDLDAVAPNTTRETLTRDRAENGFIAPAAPAFKQKCGKCHGTGTFTTYTGRNLGPCFTCKGKGTLEFKTSPETRAKGRERAQAKNVEKLVAISDAIKAFQVEHNDIWKWFIDNEKATNPFEFATNLFDALNKYGHLTERQLAAAQSCVDKRNAKRAEWAAQNAATVAAAPAVGAEALTALTAAFDKAKAHKTDAQLVFAGHRVYFPTSGRHVGTGTLFVKAGRTYVGRVTEGRFIKGQEATEAQVDTALELLRDPAAAAIKHGKATKQCSCCGRRLTREDSIERGIGPICAEAWGF